MTGKLLSVTVVLASMVLGGGAAMAGDTPGPGAASGEPRVFELRTYHVAPGKLEALQARFRDHTNALFRKHGMTIIGFWTPTDGPAAQNTLIYILAFPNRDAARAAWKAFREDPAWKKVQAASERDGKLVDKVDSVFMTPTDYSPIQ